VGDDEEGPVDLEHLLRGRGRHAGGGGGEVDGQAETVGAFVFVVRLRAAAGGGGANDAGDPVGEACRLEVADDRPDLPGLAHPRPTQVAPKMAVFARSRRAAAPVLSWNIDTTK
jgi:hypothetical protein